MGEDTIIVVAPTVKFKCFNWADKKTINRTVNRRSVWGWKTGETYEVTETVFAYDTTDDVLKAAAKFATSIPAEKLINIAGGDNFHNYGCNFDIPVGCVIVWYWE